MVARMGRDLHSFLRRLEEGEALLVVRGDRVLAEVRPMPAGATQPHPYGLCAGQFTVPDDFDHLLPDEILLEFEGP